MGNHGNHGKPYWNFWVSLLWESSSEKILLSACSPEILIHIGPSKLLQLVWLENMYHPGWFKGGGQDQCKPPAHEVKNRNHTTSQCCNQHHRKMPHLGQWEYVICPKPEIRGFWDELRYQHLSTTLSGNWSFPYWNQPVPNQPWRQSTYKRVSLPSNACSWGHTNKHISHV